MTKYPAFWFYPGDWRKDPDLARCSHAAKGMLMDMLCLMFECNPRGRLATAGRPWSDDEICRATFGAAETLEEIMSKGVLSRDETGAIFSRRMIRDEDTRIKKVKAGAEGGNKKQANRVANGWQNPSTTPSTAPSKTLADGYQEGYQKATSSVSVSESVSMGESPLNPPVGERSVSGKRDPAIAEYEDLPMLSVLKTPEFSSAWADWVADRKARRKSVTKLAARGQLKALEEMGHDGAIGAIRQSIRQGWAGLFPVRTDGAVGGRPEDSRPLSRVPAPPGKYAGIAERHAARLRESVAAARTANTVSQGGPAIAAGGDTNSGAA